MAVAAGAAFAGTDPITSANVVGFAPAPAMESEGEAVGGVLFMVPQFKNIAGTEYSIQDIVLDPENASPYEDNIQLISLEGDGDVIESYIYVKDFGKSKLTGWLSDDGASLSDRTIIAGEGVIVETMSPCSITTSGEVSKGESSFEMDVGGVYFLGNPCPVTKDIQDFELDPENASVFEDNIQFIDLEGAGDVIESYIYVKDFGKNKLTGWLSDDGASLAERDILPGEGIIVEVMNDGCAVKLPAAL